MAWTRLVIGSEPPAGGPPPPPTYEGSGEAQLTLSFTANGSGAFTQAGYTGQGEAELSLGFQADGQGSVSNPEYSGSGNASLSLSFGATGVGSFTNAGYVGNGQANLPLTITGNGLGEFEESFAGEGNAVLSLAFSATGFGTFNTPVGVLAQDVPGDGKDGPAFAFDEISLPEDTDKFVTYAIVIPPVGVNSFVTYPDTSFTLDAPPGGYFFVFDLYFDGVKQGQYTRNILVGCGSSGGSRNIDGGRSDSVYLPSQNINGGSSLG